MAKSNKATPFSDPIIRAEAVRMYIESHDIQTYEYGIKAARKAYSDMQDLILHETMNHDAAEKKLRDNDVFFNNLVESEIAEQLSTIAMLDYQHELNMDFVEEMERLQNKALEELKLSQQITLGELSPEQKALIEMQALNTAINKIEGKIKSLNDSITSIERSWGGSTWEEGQKKQAAIMANEFGKNLLEGVNMDKLSEPERVKITEEAKQIQKDLQTKLENKIDPAKLQETVAKSYAAVEIPVAPPLTSSSAPPVAPPLTASTISLASVFNHSKVIAALEHVFSKMQFSGNDKKSNNHIKDLIKSVESGPALQNYCNNVDGMSKRSGLIKARDALLDIAQNIKSHVVENTPSSPKLK